jgi:hypothetical protein
MWRVQFERGLMTFPSRPRSAVIGSPVTATLAQFWDLFQIKKEGKPEGHTSLVHCQGDEQPYFGKLF